MSEEIVENIRRDKEYISSLLDNGQLQLYLLHSLNREVYLTEL